MTPPAAFMRDMGRVGHQTEHDDGKNADDQPEADQHVVDDAPPNPHLGLAPRALPGHHSAASDSSIGYRSGRS